MSTNLIRTKLDRIRPCLNMFSKEYSSLPINMRSPGQSVTFNFKTQPATVTFNFITAPATVTFNFETASRRQLRRPLSKSDKESSLNNHAKSNFVKDSNVFNKVNSNLIESVDFDPLQAQIPR